MPNDGNENGNMPREKNVCTMVTEYFMLYAEYCSKISSELKLKHYPGCKMCNEQNHCDQRKPGGQVELEMENIMTAHIRLVGFQDLTS